MNDPCKHCDKADNTRIGYFKCDSPCKQAKACYENNEKMFNIFKEHLSEKKLDPEEINKILGSKWR